jgi:hypothetical protein
MIHQKNNKTHIKGKVQKTYSFLMWYWIPLCYGSFFACFSYFIPKRTKNDYYVELQKLKGRLQEAELKITKYRNLEKTCKEQMRERL